MERVDTIIHCNCLYLSVDQPYTYYSILDSEGAPTRMPLSLFSPPQGSLKLNIDRASKGKHGPYDIVGVLRDHLAYIRGTFSNHIGIEDSNYAEFHAILEGVSFFLSSLWATTHHLKIKSDSSNSIQWANDHLKVPWSMKNISNATEVYA